MKKKIFALVLVLFMIPAAVVLAAQGDWAELRMAGYYAVIGGDQSITIRSHTEHSGKGGYSRAVYACELTGNESKAELDALAVKLIKSGTKPVWGGSKNCFHGGAYTADPVYTMKASDYAPGSYLYVCYAFVCEGSGHNHYPPKSQADSAVGAGIDRVPEPPPPLRQERKHHQQHKGRNKVV